MIILKANRELQMVFQKVIKTLGKRTDWENIFLVLDNSLVLYGKNRCLFFSFDKKRVFESVVEVPVNKDRAIPIDNNPLLTNTLNLTLYVFGKWGILGSLVVNQDYNHLNRMFANTWRNIKVEPSFTNENFRYFEDGIQITYEEVIQKILDGAEQMPAPKEEEKIGLWHKMRWNCLRAPFIRSKKKNTDKEVRLGNNFYPINYICPHCYGQLHMVVYPKKKEMVIDTSEGKVYLARMYSCSGCNRFYTPRPEKLISDGDVYVLDFEDDRQAYEDYLEIAGERGARTTNPNFNVYERDYGKIKSNLEKNKKVQAEDVADTLEEEIVTVEPDGEETLQGSEQVLEKEKKAAAQKQKNKEKRLSRRGFKSGKKNPAASVANKEKVSSETVSLEAVLSENYDSEVSEQRNDQVVTVRTRLKSGGRRRKRIMAVRMRLKSDRRRREPIVAAGTRIKISIQRARAEEAEKKLEETEKDLQDVKFMSLKELRETGKTIKTKEKVTREKDTYVTEMEQAIEKQTEMELQRKAAACVGKNCKEIKRVIREIEQEDYPEEKKKVMIANLRQLQMAAGKREIEQMIAFCPSDLSQTQYETYKEQLKEYKDMGMDVQGYENWFKEKRNNVEKQEIQQFINRFNANDREALLEAYQSLTDMNFAEENVEPVLQKIHDKIVELDEAAIAAICPEPEDVTFDEGVEAFRQIAEGMFLPELKIETLDKLDKRLQKLKADEAEQLIQKLERELGPYVEGNDRIHFCNIRQILGQEDEEDRVVTIALKSYAANRRKYEYPLLVCDSSRHKSGLDGFLLTPDQVYYKTTFSSDVLEVRSIEKLGTKKGFFKKHICAEMTDTDDVKLSGLLEVKDIEGFQNAFNQFLEYLKEKPQSRKISYMAKEIHEVKCCYRCGYVYTEGSVCPKCGSRQNR